MLWAVFDTTYLCHRAFHAMDGDIDVVIPRVINDIEIVQELHCPDSCVFCFDRGGSLRKQACSSYKSNRILSESEQEARSSLQEEIRLLACKALPEAGYRNIHHVKGYEADDFVAAACQQIESRKGKAIIVGSDHDLWQLLSSRVSMWNPASKQLLTADWFRNTWGLEPSAWADVKAIAGCSSDNVAGVEGVGEKKAAKFLQGEMPVHHKAYEAIVKGTSGIWQANLPLVRLPFAGTPDITLQSDEEDCLYRLKEAWNMEDMRERVARRKRLLEPQETSLEAFEAIQPHRSRLQEVVFSYLLKCGQVGATDEEMQQHLGLKNNTQAPRRLELVRRGDVIDSGRKRNTSSGKRAIVWVVNPERALDELTEQAQDLEMGY